MHVDRCDSIIVRTTLEAHRPMDPRRPAVRSRGPDDPGGGLAAEVRADVGAECGSAPKGRHLQGVADQRGARWSAIHPALHPFFQHRLGRATRPDPPLVGAHPLSPVTPPSWRARRVGTDLDRCPRDQEMQALPGRPELGGYHDAHAPAIGGHPRDLERAEPWEPLTSVSRFVCASPSFIASASAHGRLRRVVHRCQLCHATVVESRP